MRYFKYILGCCLCLPVVVHANPCDDWVAKAVSIQGTVELRLAKTPTKKWQTVKPGQIFCASDILRVRQNSRAALLLSNDTILRLDQNTTITFSQIAPDQASTLNLSSGIAHFISRVRQAFEVITPFVNAAIEGTEFVVAVEQGQSQVTVFEGQVKAYNNQGQAILTNGQSAVAGKDQAPLTKLLVQPRDAVQWALHYPPIISEDDVSISRVAEPWREQLQNSLQAYRQGDLDAALAHLSELSALLDNASIYTYRAALRLNVGRVSAAQADLARAAELEPQNAQVLALQAIIAVVQNDKGTALQLAQAAVTTAPDSASSYLALSYAQQTHFDIPGALTTMQEAVKQDPRNALAWSRLAELRLMSGELTQALSDAQAAEAIAPHLARTQSVLGFAYLTRIEVAKAQEAFNKAITLDQTDPMSRLGLGLAIIHQGELEAGRRELEFAASLDPNNSLIRSYLGKAYYEEKRDKVAGEQYEMAKQLDPNDPTPWLYNAIRKQTDNRPVEALQDLQKSIELNNNRAVFRSQLHLDQDLAARSTDQALIYRDLRFEQLALSEAWKSVNADPSNFSSHRFLADSYSILPRHEIARVSELLQSQLLQPININPVQPKLSESNLTFLDVVGANTAALNEYNPLFFRNQTRVDISGLTAENDTSGGEAILSGIYNRASYSLGYYHYETDGFHDNNDFDQNIYNAFAQIALSYKSSVQIEVSSNDTDEGDIFRFDPNNFSRTRRTENDIDRLRVGLFHAFSQDSKLIGSIIREERNPEDSVSLPPFGSLDVRSDIDGYSAEVRHLLYRDRWTLSTGIGYADNDIKTDETFFGFALPQEQNESDHTNVYAYSHIKTLETIDLAIGLSADRFDDESDDTDQVNPKFGITWTPTNSTTIRGAAFRVFKRTLMNNQTIEPTQVAGFNQFFDDPVNTDSRSYGIAVDHKFSHNLFSGVEFTRRDLDVPYLFEDLLAGTTESRETNWDEKIARLYLYWIPHPKMSINLSYFYEDLERDQEFSGRDDFTDVTTHQVPIGLNYYFHSGVTTRLKATYVDQDGEFIDVFSNDTAHGSDNFWVVDASIDYRLPKRMGFISIGAQNLLDENFNYQNTDPATPTISQDRMAYARINILF